MTLELRSRRAAAAIHAAVEQVQPRPLTARRPLLRGRTLVAIALAISTPPAGVALVTAGRESEPPPAEHRIVDEQREPRDDERGADRPGGPSPAPFARLDGAEKDTKAPRTLGAPQRAEGTPMPLGPLSSWAGGCDPVLADANGDIEDPAIDILEASITYEPSANKLVIRELFADIPESYLPREALLYFFDFDLDGTTYHVLAYVGPATYGEWQFDLQRDDRTIDQWPEGRRSVMHPQGNVDHAADTVTVEFGIDDFNRGERRVAEEEGRPPAAGDLKLGSTLTNITMSASSRTAGPGTTDRAHGCNYVVQ